jgi:hypothetical protein
VDNNFVIPLHDLDEVDTGGVRVLQYPLDLMHAAVGLEIIPPTFIDARVGITLDCICKFFAFGKPVLLHEPTWHSL